LETDSVCGLNFFPTFDLFIKIFKTNFSILNNTSYLEFFHSISNFNEFGFAVPNKTVNNYCSNLFEKLLEISFLLIYFNIEDNDRFSKRLFFLGFDWYRCRFYGWSIIITEKIIFFDFLFFNLFFFFSFCLFCGFISFSSLESIVSSFWELSWTNLIV